MLTGQTPHCPSLRFQAGTFAQVRIGESPCSPRFLLQKLSPYRNMNAPSPAHAAEQPVLTHAARCPTAQAAPFPREGEHEHLGPGQGWLCHRRHQQVPRVFEIPAHGVTTHPDCGGTWRNCHWGPRGSGVKRGQGGGSVSSPHALPAHLQWPGSSSVLPRSRPALPQPFPGLRVGAPCAHPAVTTPPAGLGGCGACSILRSSSNSAQARPFLQTWLGWLLVQALPFAPLPASFETLWKSPCTLTWKLKAKRPLWEGRAALHPSGRLRGLNGWTQ